MSNPVSGINVEVTGTVSGLVDAMGQSVQAVGTASEEMNSAFQRTADVSTAATKTITKNAEESASIFEGMAHRFEHSGVMVAFAVQNLMDGQQSGVNRALHSIALLGFAFGPVVGSISTATALILEHIHNLAKGSEKEVEEFQKKMEELVNGGNVEALLKKKEQLLTGSPMKDGKMVSPSDQVKGAFKGSLEDLEAEASRTKEAMGPFAGLLSLSPELKKARAELAAINADLAAAEGQREKDQQSGSMPKITVSAESDKEVERKRKEAAAKALELRLALDRAMDEIDKKYEKEAEKLLDGALKHSEEDAQKRMEHNDRANKEEAEMLQAAAKQLAEARAAGLKSMTAEEKRAADEVANTWRNAFSMIESSFEAALSKMQHKGGTFTEFMRQAGRQFLADEIRNELKIGEAKLARLIAGDTAEEASKTKSLAMSAAVAIADIANSAARGAAAAWAAMEAVPVIGPFLAPAAAAAALAGILAMAHNIKSAAGGFDIPAGLNPVTQLHAQEMVLPAHLANAVRGMAAGGGGAGGGGDVHIHAVDSVDTSRWARRSGNAAALHRGVMSHVQNGGGLPSAVGRRAP